MIKAAEKSRSVYNEYLKEEKKKKKKSTLREKEETGRNGD